MKTILVDSEDLQEIYTSKTCQNHVLNDHWPYPYLDQMGWNLNEKDHLRLYRPKDPLLEWVSKHTYEEWAVKGDQLQEQGSPNLGKWYICASLALKTYLETGTWDEKELCLLGASVDEAKYICPDCLKKNEIIPWGKIHILCMSCSLILRNPFLPETWKHLEEDALFNDVIIQDISCL